MVNSTKKGESGGPLSLRSLNHISLICNSIEDSIGFYEDILGFIPVKRPGSFGFDGAWLFNYGIGIHLLQSPNPENLPKKTEINPRDNHISFQCDDVHAVERKLQEMKIKYVKRIVEEGGIYVDQFFIHDPDCYMVEICNCGNLPVELIVKSASACRAFKTKSYERREDDYNCEIKAKTQGGRCVNYQLYNGRVFFKFILR